MAEGKKPVFKQVSTDFTKLKKVGDAAEGYLVLVSDDPIGTQGRTRPVLTLKTDDGKLLKVPVSDSAKGTLAAIAPGEYLRVTFKGEEATSRGLNPVKLYTFEVRQDV